MHLDWVRLGEILISLAVMSFLLERALAVLFETRVFVRFLDGRGVKDFLAMAAAILICLNWKFDVLTTLLPPAEYPWVGQVVTGLVIAGGSKASVKLFRDIMGLKSSAYAEKEEAEKTVRVVERRLKTAPKAGAVVGEAL